MNQLKNESDKVVKIINVKPALEKYMKDKNKITQKQSPSNKTQQSCKLYF
jgi:hypothetical protein